MQIMLEGVIFSGRSALKIYQKDNGRSIDFSVRTFDNNLASQRTRGRGIFLVESMRLVSPYLARSSEVMNYCVI
ncbi:hypothetical protein [Undibacterium sp.]|uniref:hypothetical protein n=1 Tax=Undibacterium sp. TaxID=1914977 RepID=UPI00272B614A|nr:hypothetical protein [Undibacterium sp.]